MITYKIIQFIFLLFKKDKLHYHKGVLHNITGPAVERTTGHKEWWFNGALHRYGGPAIEYSSGSKEYYIHGLRHRKDGPAIDYVGAGYKEWWVNGKRVNCSNQNEFERMLRMKVLW